MSHLFPGITHFSPQKLWEDRSWVGVASRTLPTVHVLGICDSHSLKSECERLQHVQLVAQGHASWHMWFRVLHPLTCPCDTTLPLHMCTQAWKCSNKQCGGKGHSNPGCGEV